MNANANNKKTGVKLLEDEMKTEARFSSNQKIVKTLAIELKRKTATLTEIWREAADT